MPVDETGEYTCVKTSTLKPVSYDQACADWKMALYRLRNATPENVLARRYDVRQAFIAMQRIHTAALNASDPILDEWDRMQEEKHNAATEV